MSEPGNTEDPQVTAQRLRLILDGVHDHAISMLDPAGRVETFNVPAQRIKGYALEEVRGQYFGMFFTAEDRAGGLPELELETARVHGRYEGEGYRLRKDGTQFYASVSLSALHDSSGRLVGFVKVTQDRTKYRELSMTLSRREAELRLIIDAIPGLVAYIGRDHHYRLVNRAYQEWFGLSATEIVGHSMREVLGDKAYGAVRESVERTLAGELVSFETELAYERGGARWVRVSYIPDRDDDGQVLGLITLVLDITEAKTVERQLADEARLNETLYRVGTMLSAQLDQPTIFQRLTDEATTLCRAQFGAFFYNVDDPSGGSYMLYTLSGVPRERFSQFPMPRNTAIFAPTFSGTAVMRSDDITQDPRFGKNPPYHGMPKGHLPVVSYLAVPVVARTGEVHGGLFFGHADKGVFSERDERMIVAVAAQAAVAIENARLLEATSAAEAKYRAVAESSPQFIWTTNASGAIEYANARFLEFVGHTLAEMQAGPQWEAVVHPDDASRAAATWTHALRTGDAYEVEFRFRRGADGVYRWFLSRGVPVRDEAGRITRWVGSSTDIDDRKRSEDTQGFLAQAGVLLASSLDYRAILPELARLAIPHVADACTIDLVDDDAKLERVAVSHVEPSGPASTRATAYRATLPENPTLRRVIESGRSELATEVGDPVLRSVARAVATPSGRLSSWMIVPVTAHNRSLGAIAFACAESGRRFEARDVAVAEEIGRRVGVMLDNARLFEMTQRERRRAEEASRAKDELLSVTSHELRTPLNAIVGWSRLLRGGGLPADKQARALETIERNAHIQVQLVDDLLDFSRVMTGRLRLALASVDPAQVVEAAVEVVRPAADAKGVRLQTVIEPSPGVVNADAARVQQVVWNLLTNAVKFTPRGGRVYVRMQRKDSAIEIEVSDTGIGIDASFLPHVFQPFRQQDATITRRHGGLGLGLAIAKHLVEQHGGTLEARSDGANLGATFVVRLPMAPVRSSSIPSPVPGAREARGAVRSTGPVHCPPELEGLFVLICEDEPDARDLLESILTGCKARVVAAGSVAEALERFHQRIPDVVISDIGMPDASGYDFIRRIRSLPPERGGRVPAVALTAYASLADRTRALMEGFQNHVSKPTDPDELVAVVAALTRFNRQGS